MQVKRLVDKICSTNNYIITSGNNAILVDCSISVEELEKALNGASLQAILLTHSHFDHIFKLDEITSKFNCPIFIHENGYTSLFDADKNLSSNYTAFEVQNKENINKIKNNDQLLLLDTVIKVFHTPGHSHCSVCYEIGEWLFTGDTLFSATIGRNDFWHSDASHQQKSLKKLLSLPAKTKYFAGHGKPFNHARAIKVINKYLEDDNKQ